MLFRSANDMSLQNDARTAINSVRDLADDIKIRFPLSTFGVQSDMCESIANTVLTDSVTSNNPVDPTKDQVLEIIKSRLN